MSQGVIERDYTQKVSEVLCPCFSYHVSPAGEQDPSLLQRHVCGIMWAGLAGRCAQGRQVPSRKSHPRRNPKGDN